MDHMMPDMDGVEATAIIRGMDDGDPYYRKLPIIALTANAVAGQREMFLRNGMDDFLAKPIEMNKLDTILKEWIPEEQRLEPDAAANEAPAPDFLDILNIDGVSVETGLRNSGGSVAAYANILMDFCQDAEDRANRIELCVTEDNMSMYLTLIHALKGAARSIGATEFAECAARLEEAAQNGDRDIVSKMTDKLLMSLRKLTDDIRNVIESRFAYAAQTTDTLSVTRLKMLKSALLGMDISTVNELMMDYAATPFDAKTNRALSEIERRILMFEYDAAIDRIDVLIAAAIK
jgi:CheY-like chemotaxis protein